MRHLNTARDMAEHADHPEIVGWRLETRAWDRLHRRLPRRRRPLPPGAADRAGGLVRQIQATAQEGRAWARLGQRAEVRDALDRTARLVSPLAPPDRPEHHYPYDPAKATAYTATTLAWSGDPAAEDFARAVVADLDAGPIPRPRRTASARLDLGLALVAANKPDEAAAMALAAISTGRVVASNWWRVAELLSGVERFGIPEGVELRDAAAELHPPRAPGVRRSPGVRRG